MAWHLHVRQDFYDCTTANIQLGETKRTSDLVARLSGIAVPKEKIKRSLGSTMHMNRASIRRRLITYTKYYAAVSRCSKQIPLYAGKIYLVGMRLLRKMNQWLSDYDSQGKQMHCLAVGGPKQAKRRRNGAGLLAIAQRIKGITLRKQEGVEDKVPALF